MNDLYLCVWLPLNAVGIQTVAWPNCPLLITQTGHDSSSTLSLLLDWNPTSKFCFPDGRTGGTSTFSDLAQLSQQSSTLVTIDWTLSFVILLSALPRDCTWPPLRLLSMVCILSKTPVVRIPRQLCVRPLPSGPVSSTRPGPPSWLDSKQSSHCTPFRVAALPWASSRAVQSR